MVLYKNVYIDCSAELLDFLIISTYSHPHGPHSPKLNVVHLVPLAGLYGLCLCSLFDSVCVCVCGGVIVC